ncbi:MAG: pilin [Patescibacteria group bacterium]
MVTIYKILFISLLFLALAHQVVEVRAASLDSPSENNSNFHYLAHTSLAYQLAGLPPGQPITFNEVDNLIGRVAQFMVVVSVLIAIIMIVWSGITYMYAGADTTKVTEAQTRLKNSIIGAAIVLGVGVIIQTIAGIVTRDFFCQFQLFGVCIIK